MSKVYSFRLDENNPREAQAREVIEAWVGEGYPLRHVVVEALIGLSQQNNSSTDMAFLVENIMEILVKIENGNLSDQRDKNKDALPMEFISALKISARPGLRVNQIKNPQSL